jgi:hypothetical protein
MKKTTRTNPLKPALWRDISGLLCTACASELSSNNHQLVSAGHAGLPHSGTIVPDAAVLAAAACRQSAMSATIGPTIGRE